MRILATITAAMLFTFLLVSAPAFSQEGGDRPPQAQDEKAKDKDKDAKDKAPKPDEKTARPDEGKRDESHPEMRQPDNREHPEAARPQEQRQEEQRPDQHAGRNDQHPMAAQRGKHIPDDKFRSSFGREHRFKVQRTQIVNQAQPVILYGGYNFQLVDPWPAEWSYDDDVYIDYVDGEYFLFDAMHPGIRVAVFVME